MSRALVVGSLHVDLVATAAAMPTPGASVLGESFSRSPGGKAGNQAVQLARLGVETALLARVGADAFGEELVAAVRGAGVDVSTVRRDAGRATGASTVIAAAGDYLSVIVPGASSALDAADVAAADGPLDVVVTQLELPPQTVALVAQAAGRAGAPLVLNASPLPDDFHPIAAALGSADTLVVNREEAGRLAGRAVADAAGAELAAREIQRRHAVPTVVVTLGSAGAVCRHPGGVDYYPAWPIRVVDTVGAGDAFLGAWVAARLEGRSVPLSLERATAAGAMAAAGRGAWGGMATTGELDAFVAQGPNHRNLSRGTPPRRRGRVPGPA